MSKKVINQPENVVPELLQGFVKAYEHYYEMIPDVKGIACKHREKGKVAVVIGGGSGHEPMFEGFLGKGLPVAAACGNIFTSPDPETIYKTANHVESGAGVLFCYGNYSGDNMNFDIAEAMLNDEGVKTAHVRVWDDCASAPKERFQDRRGIAGDLYVFKTAGAAAQLGYSLEEILRITEKARNEVRSIGVATAPGIIPGNTIPPFTLADDEIEFGIGIHGEPGIKRTKLLSANEMTDVMYNYLVDDMKLTSGQEVCAMINGLGSTTIAEMCIVYNRLRELLDRDNILVYDSEIKSYCTCQEMGGFSITLFRLDDELKELYDLPCFSPYYAKGGTKNR